MVGVEAVNVGTTGVSVDIQIVGTGSSSGDREIASTSLLNPTSFSILGTSN